MEDQLSRYVLFELAGFGWNNFNQNNKTCCCNSVQSRNASRDMTSMHSVKTGTTEASDETAEALARGDKNVAHYRGILVWAKEHQVSMVLSSEDDHTTMKTVCILLLFNVLTD